MINTYGHDLFKSHGGFSMSGTRKIGEYLLLRNYQCKKCGIQVYRSRGDYLVSNISICQVEPVLLESISCEEFIVKEIIE